MTHIPLNELTKNINSRYKLVMVAAQRASELTSGFPPLVNSTAKKVSTVALEEIVAGKVKYEKTEETKEINI